MTHIVGERYDLLCLRLSAKLPIPVLNPMGGKTFIDTYKGFRGWLPLLTPFTIDEDFFQNPFRYHSHIAYQFVAESLFRRELARTGSEERLALSAITMPRDDVIPYLPLRTRSVLCLRPALARPALEEAYWHPALRKKHACAALLNGKCPHRGTPVEAMYREGGTLVCPAHGLKFSARTGEAI